MISIMCFVWLMISRSFSGYCLIDHPWCSWRLIAAVLRRLSALIWLILSKSGIFALKVKTILIHIHLFWKAFLTHIFLWHNCVPKCFYNGVSFVWTRLKTSYRILKRFAPFLHPWYTHWFNQWWENIVLLWDIKELFILLL